MAVRVSLQSSSNEAFFKEISLLTPQSLVPSTTGSRSSPTLDHPLTMVILVKTVNREEVFSQPPWNERHQCLFSYRSPCPLPQYPLSMATQVLA